MLTLLVSAAGAIALTLDGVSLVGYYDFAGSEAVSRHGEQTDATHAAITTEYKDGSRAVCTLTETDGQDCTLACRLTAGRAALDVNFNGLTAAFDPAVPKLSGTMPWWDGSYYADHGVWHPSTLTPVGCVYASDGARALAAYSGTEFGRRSLITSGHVADYTIANPFALELHTERHLAPGETQEVDLTVCLTADLTPAGLYSGYRAALQVARPAPGLAHDRRPMVEMTSVDQAWVTPANPGGYNGDGRRLDRPAGCAAFLHTILPPLEAAHGGGCIFWSPGGAEPIMYPPEFGTNLQRVAATWPLLADALHARGMRAGVCARPGDCLDAAGQCQRINPDDPAQVAAMLHQFALCAKLSVDAYYLDSFGGDFGSVPLLRRIREQLGPGVPLYTEYATDATLPYADHYCEYHDGGTVAWSSTETREALQYLFPESVWLASSRARDEARPDEVFRRMGLTKLVQDYLLAHLAPAPSR